MIVVDIGCHPQEHEESVYKLAKAFQPSVLYGFDPHPGLVPGVEHFEHPRVRPGRRGHSARQPVHPTVIVRAQIAAWTHDGFVGYQEAGICSGVVPGSEQVVPCFDLIAWLKTLPMPDVEVVVKIDAEGAEYPLLTALRASGLDLLIDQALIEYHPENTANGWYMEERPLLRCPAYDWDRDW